MTERMSDERFALLEADELVFANSHVEVMDELRAEREANRELLREFAEAVDDIESWGAYASDYFQKKHDLDGTVERYRALIEKVKADE